jgi:hypothetical protein
MEPTYDQVKEAVSAGKVRELITHNAPWRDESGATMIGPYYVAEWTEPGGIRVSRKLSPIQKAELENEFGVSVRDPEEEEYEEAATEG